MTNKEAKHTLEAVAGLIDLRLPGDKVSQFRQAYELAIKALEECAKNAISETNQDLTKINQDDLISRSELRARFQEILDRGDMFCEYDIIGMLDNAPTADIKPFASFTFDKDELDRIVEERVIEPIKNGELVIKEKRSTSDWIPISEGLPEEKLFNPSGSDFAFDFEEVLCTTIWGDVRVYKFGKPIGHDKPHFWFGGGIMDEYVIAWQYKPEPYKEASHET